MNSKSISHLYSSSGLLILFVLFLAVVAISNALLSGVRLDLTDNKLYTVSDGTRSVLENIEEPINLYFFYSKEVAQDIPSINNYARRVQETLEEFAAIGGSKLKLNIINPEPFSDAEDRAVELGVDAVPVNDLGTNLYFGLAGTNAIDDSQVIPFFRREGATQLEYDLAKMIYQLANPEKAKVGFLSTLEMGGGFNQQTFQPDPEWFIRQRIGEFFEVENLDTGVTLIPEDIDVLVLVHPANLSEATLYAIDQFVLAGGRAMVFVDPHASVPRDPRGGPPPIPTASDLGALFKAWGIDYKPDEFVADAKNALSVQAGRGQPSVYHYGMVSIKGDTISQEDVITRGFKTMNFGFAGHLKKAAGAEVEFVPFVQSSDQAQIINASRAAALFNPQDLQKGFKASGEQYVLAARIRGKVKTAFAEGAPAIEVAEGEEAQPGQQQPANHLAESSDQINVIVVADTDMLTDRFWVQTQQMFGQRVAVPWADNGDFTVNSIDNLMGSNALIGIQSRADFSRPFEKVDELRREADAKFRAKEQELQASLQETERKINELQSQKQEGNAMILSPEQEAAIVTFQDEKLKIRKQLREVRHQLDKDIDYLGSVLKFINIVLVPLVLTILVVMLTFIRRGRAVATGGQA